MPLIAIALSMLMLGATLRPAKPKALSYRSVDGTLQILQLGLNVSDSSPTLLSLAANCKDPKGDEQEMAMFEQINTEEHSPSSQASSSARLLQLQFKKKDSLKTFRFIWFCDTIVLNVQATRVPSDQADSYVQLIDESLES